MHLSADLHTQTPEAEAEREQMFVQRFQWVACAKIRLRFEFQVGFPTGTGQSNFLE